MGTDFFLLRPAPIPFADHLLGAILTSQCKK